MDQRPDEGSTMRLEYLAGGPGDQTACGRGPCPTVYTTDGGDVVVQGFKLDRKDVGALDIPENEDVVRIPSALLLSAAKKHGSTQV
jgi:hypothetical protein